MNKEDNAKIQEYISDYIKQVNMAGEILKSKVDNLCNKEIVFDKKSVLTRLVNYEPVTEDEWEYMYELMITGKLVKDERRIVMNARDMVTIENGKQVIIKCHFIK